MALTKHKLKKQILEKTLNKTEHGGGRREDDPKILPYYKLDTNEKMEVMFVPYEDGDLFKHFKKHGPNMGVASVGSVDCIYHSRGESCPACAKGFSYVKDGKGTPMSKKWMAKDYYVAQVVVIDCPFDIPELEDGNQVRIFYMPFAVMEKIKESYAEGIVEDPTEHVFVIKKTTNQGGNASYANSFFRPQPAGDEIYEAFGDAVVEIHDLYDADIAPAEVTVDEVAEWVEKADKALNEDEGGNGGRTRRESGNDSSDDGGAARPAGNSRLGRRSERKAEDDGDEGDDGSQDDTQSKTTESSGGGNSLKDRLRRARASGQ